MSRKEPNRSRRKRDGGFRRSAASRELEETIKDAYMSGVTNFSDAYSKWVQVRRCTLRRLDTLADELHDKQKDRNKTQCTLKEMSQLLHTNPKTETVIDDLASFFGVLSVAASGIVSIVEACDIDSYQKKFDEIMIPDSEATKSFYEIRSRCVKEYRDIQEAVRHFQPNSFSSVVDTVSTALKTDKLAIEVCDDAFKMMTAIGKFLNSALDVETMYTVGSSVGNYVAENPAVLDACVSTGRVAVDLYDMFRDKKEERSELRTDVDNFANHLTIRSDEREISRLNSIILSDSSQSKLESKIRSCIENLQNELDDVSEAHSSLIRWD